MRVYNGRATHKRGNYKSKVDIRGKTTKEMKAIAAFWRQHSMDDMLTKTPEETDQIIDKWLLEYEQKQQERNKSWWYPEPLRR